MPLLLRICYVLILAFGLAAAPHRPRLFPNPNIVILGIAGDSRGDLWLAAEDGLYRFDGVHYQRIPGLPIDHIRYVGVTRNDVVWAGGPTGLVRYDGSFRVIDRGNVTDFWPFPDHLLVRMVRDMMRIALDGSVTHLPFTAHSKPFGIDADGNLWQGFLSFSQVCTYSAEDLFRPRAPTDKCVSLPRGIRLTYSLPDANGRLWVADENQAAHYESDGEAQIVERLPANDPWRPGPLVRGYGKQLWFIGETVQELSGQVVFRAPEEDQKYLPTAGYEDSRGHLWVADRGKGLIEWIPDPSWNRWFTEDFARQPVHSIFRSADGSLIGATPKGLVRLEHDQWTPVASPPHCCSFVLPEADGAFLTALRGIGPVRLSNSGAIVARVSAPLAFDSFRKILRDRDGTIWFAYRAALLRMTATHGEVHLTPVPLPPADPLEHGAMDIRLDSTGRIWIGDSGGLSWRDASGEWHRLATDTSLKAVRSFAFGGAGDGDSIWVASGAAMPPIHLSRQGNSWQARQFTPETEIGSDNTRFIERDSRGWIWRGTMNGVYVSDGRNVEPEHWLHLNRRSGLSVDQLDELGFFEDRDGSVWLSGAEGVTHIQPDASWFTGRNATAPHITRLEVDGVEQSQPQRPGAVRTKKSLRLEFGSVFSSPFRDSPFEYRLVSDARPTEQTRTGRSSGTLEFSGLPSGAYTLAIRYAGSDGEPLTLSFQAGSSLWWLWLFSLTLSSCFMLWLFRRSDAMEKARYRASKFVYIVRQRYRVTETERPPAADYTGQVLRGRYLIEEPISRSDFSTVYDAQDIRDGRRIAVKILRPQVLQPGRTRDKFALEIAALQSIHHPGIVSILDWWINPRGEGSIAMPFLEGPTLRTALRNGPLPGRRVARLLPQIGSALAAIHGRGIVHRDVKPENIILTADPKGDEQSVLVDFGAAGFRAAENELALTASPAGTFYYLAPERLSGHYAPASDVYALAVIALETLSGKRLYDLGNVYSSSTFEGELAGALRPSLGDACVEAARLLRPCFNPDPNGRPADALDWANRFAVVLNQDRFPS